MSGLLLPLLQVATFVALAVLAYRVGAHRRVDFLREAVIVVAAYIAYSFVRGSTEADFADALSHANAIEAFERSRGIYIEEALQAAIVGERWIVEAMNAIYLWGHLPVISLTATWMYVKRPRLFRVFRNAFLVSGAIGLVLFAAFPTAPPRLADLGFVDTVTEYAGLYRFLQPSHLTNQYAAFPSLHFGWSLLIGIALFTASSRLPLRAFAVLSPLLMLAAIVLTANHYLIDALAGGIVALIGLAVAYRLRNAELHPIDAIREPAQASWRRARVATLIVLDPRARLYISVRRGSADAGDGSPAIFIA
ncbi:MAG: phosphatase PAP2 family protein [Chloroflexi bacterium]|nr:phosphatase PAP2 family protein [Chloroflexota bacterium]